MFTTAQARLAPYAHRATEIVMTYERGLLPLSAIGHTSGALAARGYKRDADPWHTRALILERLDDLSFAPQSRMAREDVLQSDHCFDAVLSAYTAYLWARDGWPTPDGCFTDDGWIVAPP